MSIDSSYYLLVVMNCSMKFGLHLLKVRWSIIFISSERAYDTFISD